jgi:hypothetical protein
MRRHYGQRPRGLAGLARDLQVLGAVARTVRNIELGAQDRVNARAAAEAPVIELVEVSPGVFATPAKPRTANPDDAAARALDREVKRVSREVSRVDREVRGVLDGLDQLAKAFGGRSG